jgi:hypothetical protein
MAGRLSAGGRGVAVGDHTLELGQNRPENSGQTIACKEENDAGDHCCQQPVLKRSHTIFFLEELPDPSVHSVLPDDPVSVMRRQTAGQNWAFLPEVVFGIA